jgi:hypothetical protein
MLTQHHDIDLKAIKWILPQAQISYSPNAENWVQATVQYNTQILTLTREQSRKAVQKQGQKFDSLLPALDASQTLNVTTELKEKNKKLNQVVNIKALDRQDPYWRSVVSTLAQTWHAPILYRDEILDTRLRVLLAHFTDSDPESIIPYLPSALARRERTEQTLLKRKIPIYKNLPPVLAEEEVHFRSASDILKRAMVLLTVASTSTTLSRYDAAEMIYAWGLRHEVTPAERAYFFNVNFGELEKQEMNLRFEAAYILLWSIGLANQANFPSQLSPVSSAIQKVKSRKFASWMRDVKLRNPSEILERLDWAYRLNYALQQQKQNNWDSFAGLRAEVVPQWYQALTWITGTQKWDTLSAPSQVAPAPQATPASQTAPLSTDETAESSDTVLPPDA